MRRLPAGQAVTAARQARLDKYAELRDGGTSAWDAAVELGITQGSGQRYERWYRARAGLPSGRGRFHK